MDSKAINAAIRQAFGYGPAPAPDAPPARPLVTANAGAGSGQSGAAAPLSPTDAMNAWLHSAAPRGSRRPAPAAGRGRRRAAVPRPRAPQACHGTLRRQG